ncbi:MAG: CoA-binding protein [Verrucomicrobia bacterium]|nr:CoA-binding protein [Verrucomicrobiota bacterium]MCH8513634.1 CoA-binding protein [Kiritimatiellia bacterium]
MHESNPQTVVVVGASPNPERYANKAVRALLDHGHRVIPLHPALKEVYGLQVIKTLEEISEEVNTVTLYVNAVLSSKLRDSLLDLHPRRVIFNPGAENTDLRIALERENIECLEACTLVMLGTGQF